MDPRELRGCPLFETLSSDQLRAVAALATRREVAGGQPLFKEGDAGAEMYVVVSGRVRISKRVPGVGEEALSILEPGSYVLVDPPHSYWLAPRSLGVLISSRPE